MHLARKQIKRHWGIIRINSLRCFTMNEPIIRDSNSKNITDTISVSLITGLIIVGKNLKYNAPTAMSTHDIMERQKKSLFRTILPIPRLIMVSCMCSYVIILNHIFGNILCLTSVLWEICALNKFIRRINTHDGIHVQNQIQYLDFQR